MKQILVVDDHPFIQKFYSITLSRLPVRTFYAGDGAEAVRMAEAVKPDLIFMDYHLPGMNGEDAARRIRQNHALKEVPIIAITADSRSQAEKLEGFDGFLLKPVRAEEVIALVRRYLGAEAGAARPTSSPHAHAS